MARGRESAAVRLISTVYEDKVLGKIPEEVCINLLQKYQNEKKLRYQGFNEETEEEYTILRTYRQNNLLELVCKRGVD